ncbi:ATP-dependent DNA helicase [Bacillus phage vB_BceH_LY2]|nr:ATP-dependent DNA helicase [Bacillus phage vB_BceH_LY2]
MIIKVGIMHTVIDFQNNISIQEKVQEHMHHKLGVKVEGAFHSRAYKAGVWDGITDFYDMKEDKIHTCFLPTMLEGIRELQDKYPNITYEVEDNRPAPLVHFDSIDEEIKVWKKGTQLTLRDYQHESVKQIIKEQVGIVNLATGGGKSLVAAGVFQQLLPYVPDDERLVFAVHSKEILRQTMENISDALQIPMDELGLVGEGKFDIEGKKLVFVMLPTLHSALKDPKKGVSFTQKDRLVKQMAEDIAPKFLNTVNTRTLIKNYLRNWTPKTKNDLEVETILTTLAYDNAYTDKKVQMVLRSYKGELEKILMKKNKKNFDKWKKADDFIKSIRVIVCDESHRSKGETWFDTITKCENAQYRVGLTGTVNKKDELLYRRITGLFGDIVTKVSNDYLINRGVTSKPRIRFVDIKTPRGIELAESFLEAYKLGVVENDYRSEIAVKLAVAFYKQKKAGVLLSVNHINHGEKVKELIESYGYSCGFLKGELTAEERQEELNRFESGEYGFLIGTSLIDEGLDLSCIACLVMLGAGKSMRQVLQRIGRGLRLNGVDGNQTLVLDFWDATHKYLLNHSKERLKIYNEEKFDVKFIGRDK